MNLHFLIKEGDVKTKKKLFWILNFSVLAMFSLYALSGTLGFANKKAYADTLADGNFHARSKHFMVVDKDKDDDKDKGTSAGASDSTKEICTLNDQQVAELDAFFKVNTFSLTVNGDVVTIAAVSGRHLTKKQLMDFLKASDSTLQCKLVQQHHVFFLPVLPQIS